MIYIRTGSQALSILTLLAVTGEYPTASLRLLGNERTVKAMVHKMTTMQTYRLPQTETEITGKLLQISGRGSEKTVRLCKRTALPILTRLGAEAYYQNAYLTHHASGGTAHRERNHRVAEATAMCMRAGLEIRPYFLPSLQNREILHIVPDAPSFYLAKSLKQVGGIEQNKTMFTRMVGAVFTPGAVYAVYNTRGAVMKWSGMGEFKALQNLIEIGRLNAGNVKTDAAILFGQSDEIALGTLIESDKSRRMEFRFDSIYRHVHFVPMNDFGTKLLHLLSLPDWDEKILSLLFDSSDRSYNRGVFEYDAYINGRFIYSHLGSDLARLIRFREAQRFHENKPCEILCFPEQAPFLRKYLGADIALKTIAMDLIEAELCPERRNEFAE